MSMNMEAEFAEGQGGASPGTTRRAIRCDKESPCSNCRSARRTCSSTGLGQKPKEPRQRVLISSQYEKKIDDMQQRLAGIEELLRNMSTSSSTHAPTIKSVSVSGSNATSPPSQQDGTGAGRHASSSRLEPQPPGMPPTSSPHHERPLDSELDPFEGSSSLTAHATFASDFLEHAVQVGGASNLSNPRMEGALSNLRHMLKLLKTNKSKTEDGLAWERNKAKPNWMAQSLSDCPMPPIELVVDKLKELKRTPGSMMLLVVLSFTDIDQFITRCRHVYFNKDDFSESLFIIVNVGLMYLFFEKALNAPAESPEKATYESCWSMCNSNVEQALAYVPLLMPANLENIEAMLMGASYAIDASRPSLAWLLVSRCAHMCRTMGLHQDQGINDDDPKATDKLLLFWSCYMLDKGLSLRLGRASILQDYDISAPSVLSRTHGAAGQPSAAILSLWIKFAEVQGRMYQRLYSPGALRQAEGQRMEQVQRIVGDTQMLLSETLRLMDELRAQRAAMAASPAAMPGRDRGISPAAERESKMYELILKSDEVSYRSGLALAYRAMPPSGTRSRTFSDECLDSARMAMQSHQEAMEMMGDTGLQMVYLHWTILYAPFIPFIVIFCHIIEVSSSSPAASQASCTDDLKRLELFVTSLSGATNISQAIEKLHRLSQILYNVAQLYVEAKAQQTLDPVGLEFDLYLGQLGFMPMDEGNGQSSGGSTNNNGNNNNNNDEVSGHQADAFALEDSGMPRSAGLNNQLGDWFSGGNYIMGLVEEDLSSFNTPAW